MFHTPDPPHPAFPSEPRPLSPPAGAAPARSAVVIGAGWAGLAAAVGLVEAGWAVTVLEAAPQAGGRARSLSLSFGDDPVEVDNGQHLLIGAYRATLGLLERIGTPADSVLSRSSLHLQGPGGLDLRAAPLPAPLHLAWALLRARGLDAGARWAMVRLMGRLRLHGPQSVAAGQTVSEWLDQLRQPPSLRARIWVPLCVGALNTPPERACARTFAQVLCDALLAGARDADFLLPRATLGQVLPEPGLAWLAARGARLALRTPCRRLAPLPGGGWRADTDAGPVVAARMVVATPPRSAARLLAGSVPEAALGPLDGFEYEPIATVWLGWHQPVSLPTAMMLQEHVAVGEHGQWLFGREPPAGGRIRAVAGVVISAAGRGAERPGPLAEAVARQVARQLGVPSPAHARAIIERQATIRCSPSRPRIDTDALAAVSPGIALAGDWCWHRYPATLESAVRSGDAAAAWLATGRVQRA
jgi:squalene-associated FAD-dependent desaturase